MLLLDVLAVLLTSICCIGEIKKRNESASLGWGVAFIYSLIILRHYL